MKFSWEWIQEHIKLDVTAQEAADMLSLRGLTVDEVIEVDDDIVFDVDITTNRPDAMNIRGIARELSAITGVSLEHLNTSYHEQTKRSQEFASVAIADEQDCHRFCGRAMTNVTSNPTPAWMSKRLERVGMRSINLLVDITNYVLWELGHPMHGYDLDLIPEGKIIVRKAKNNEELVTLDGEKRKLDDSILVIADSNRAIGLGGIMGGADTEMSEKTKNIFLECAYFEPISTRKSSKKLGLSTEASYRFERGMDVDDIETAIDRACHFYQKLAGAEVCKEMIDEYPTVHSPSVITMRQDRLKSFAGMDISKDKVANILTSLDITATYRENIWKITIPSRRVDLSREVDIYEEIIRIIGYDEVPPTIPHVEQKLLEKKPIHTVIDQTFEAMIAVGYSEVINYDFVDPARNKLFAPEGVGEPIKVLNPIASPHMDVMRQSLAVSLVENVRHNVHHGNHGVRIFEVARAFYDSPEGPQEETILAIAADGAEAEPEWPGKPRTADFYEIKGVIENLFTRLGITGIIFNTGSKQFLATGVTAEINIEVSGNIERGNENERKPIGWFGQLNPALQDKYDLVNPVFIGQISLDSLINLDRQHPQFIRPSAYPIVNRDLSFVLPAGKESEICYEQIANAIRKTGVDEIVEVRLLDRYQGKETGGATSMTVRVVYQADDRTLTQEEVEGYHAKVKDSLAGLKLQLR